MIETEPSTIIHYLLRSDAHARFVSSPPEYSAASGAGVGTVAVGSGGASAGQEGNGQHLELQFSSDTAKFYCCSYFR